MTTEPIDPTGIKRRKERAKTDRVELDAILDAAYVGTLSTVIDGKPWVVPLLYGRHGDRLVLHGSTGAGALRHVAAGASAAFCVTVLDGLVFADSLFDSSANYRSAVVHGTLTQLSAEAASDALYAMSERMMPGRRHEVRANTAKDLAATLAVALPITDGQWTAKVRTGGPGASESRVDVWRGVLPVHLTYGEPVPADDVPEGTEVSDSVRRLAGHRLDSLSEN